MRLVFNVALWIIVQCDKRALTDRPISLLLSHNGLDGDVHTDTEMSTLILVADNLR